MASGSRRWCADAGNTARDDLPALRHERPNFLAAEIRSLLRGYGFIPPGGALSGAAGSSRRPPNLRTYYNVDGMITREVSLRRGAESHPESPVRAGESASATEEGRSEPTNAGLPAGAEPDRDAHRRVH